MIEFNSNWMFSRDVSSMMGTLYGEQNVPVEVMLPHDAMVLEEKNENNPTGNAYKEPIFSITYVRSFNDEIKFYLFANDLERNISPSFQSAAEGYNITLLPWSQKASWIGQLRLA